MSSILRVGILSQIDLDPFGSQDWLSSLVLDQVYETPFDSVDPKRPPQPSLLSSDLESLGSTTLRARVRSDLRFSDGSVAGAAALVESLGRSRPLSEWASVRQEGSEHLIFDLVRPNVRFEYLLTQRFCALVKPGREGPIGTGPYLVDASSTPDNVVLRRNPYSREEVAIETIEVQVYPVDSEGRPTALLAALNSGEVHLTNALSRQDLRGLRGVRTWFEPGNSLAILFFNCEHPELGRPEVRRALATAIDRTELARGLFDNPIAFRASGLLPPNLGNLRDRIYPNPDRAGRELSESAPDLGRLTLKAIWSPRPYLPHPGAAAESVASLLGTVGVDVDVRVCSSGDDYFDTVRTGSYDLMLSGWVADTTDPLDYLESLLGSRFVPEPGVPIISRSNLSRFRSEEVDRILETYRTEKPGDPSGDLAEIVREQTPCLPLLHGAIAGAYSWKLKNCELSPLGIPLFARMQFKP